MTPPYRSLCVDTMQTKHAQALSKFCKELKHTKQAGAMSMLGGLSKKLFKGGKPPPLPAKALRSIPANAPGDQTLLGNLTRGAPKPAPTIKPPVAQPRAMPAAPKRRPFDEAMTIPATPPPADSPMVARLRAMMQERGFARHPAM
jgi:hypothetical protein